MDMYHEALIEEATFQVVHILDTSQTVHCRHIPGCGERDRLFVSVYSHRPTEPQIYTYMVGEAALHAAVTGLIVHYRARPAVLRVWQAVSIGYQTSVVVKNYSLNVGVHF